MTELNVIVLIEITLDTNYLFFNFFLIQLNNVYRRITTCVQMSTGRRGWLLRRKYSRFSSRVAKSPKRLFKIILLNTRALVYICFKLTMILSLHDGIVLLCWFCKNTPSRNRSDRMSIVSNYCPPRTKMSGLLSRSWWVVTRVIKNRTISVAVKRVACLRLIWRRNPKPLITERDTGSYQMS